MAVSDPTTVCTTITSHAPPFLNLSPHQTSRQIIFTMTQRPISIFKRLQALSPKGSIMPDMPDPQPYYSYNHTTQTWSPVETDSTVEPTTTTTTTTTINTNTTPLKTFTLTTWNIDFQQPCKAERTQAGLNYLSKVLLKPSDDKNNDVTPINIIFLQEMVPNDLTIIQQTKWIQDHFFITDLNHTQWRGSYGTTTLIDRRCHVQRVFRVPYSTSRMQRDGLFVDLDCQEGGETGGEIGIVLFLSLSYCSFSFILLETPYASGVFE